MAKFELDADFTKQDLDTLLDALDEWETKGQDLLHIIEKLKIIPDPTDDVPEEYREGFLNFKRSMLAQEPEAKKDKKMRREIATMMKAKIILMNQSRAADQMMDEAREEGRKGKHAD